MQWKTINGEKPRKELTEIEVLLRGMCDRQRLLDIIRNFIVFEKDKETIKKLAAYHQYWATNKAVESTVKARKGNKKNQRKARERARVLVKFYTDLAGGCCQKCGYNRSWFALDFHHINSNEKAFNVSQVAVKQNGRNEKVVAEIEKCILLCSNCHREYESGLWTAKFTKRDGIGWTIELGTIKENLLDSKYYDSVTYCIHIQKTMNF